MFEGYSRRIHIRFGHTRSQIANEDLILIVLAQIIIFEAKASLQVILIQCTFWYTADNFKYMNIGDDAPMFCKGKKKVIDFLTH